MRRSIGKWVKIFSICKRLQFVFFFFINDFCSFLFVYSENDYERHVCYINNTVMNIDFYIMNHKKVNQVSGSVLDPANCF